MTDIDDILAYPLSEIHGVDDVRDLVNTLPLTTGPSGLFRSGFVIQGTGTLGTELGQIALTAGLPLVGYVDADPRKQGTVVNGLSVEAPESAKAPVVVSVFHITEALREAEDLHSGQATSYYHLLLAFPDVFLPYWCLPHPRSVHEMVSARRVDSALDRIRDERSAVEFARQLASRAFFGVLDNSEPYGTHDCEYFVGTLETVAAGDVLLDVGAFDGDTARRFLDRSQGLDTRVVAVEPDFANFSRLRESADSSNGRILPLHAAVGDRGEVLAFAETASAGSHVLSDSGALVASTTADAIWDTVQFNRVKVDVEGFEAKVLSGAQAVIEGKRADWALAAYHRPEDLASIQEAFPKDYSMEVSSHAPRPWDSTVYLVRDTPSAAR